MIGKIFKIESMATGDGDGIRSVVFFSGCPLRCPYCHNPDAWSGGQTVDSDELVGRIKRFVPYFGADGGVTLSGGEPLLQGAFCLELIHRLHAEGIRVALDTSGSVFDLFTPQIIDAADHIILDIKFATEKEYKKYTGGSLRKVMDFFAACAGKRVRLRTVIVPGLNDNEKAMDAYVNLVKGYAFEDYELLPFHTLGFSKYESMGLSNPLLETPAMDAARVAELQKYLKNCLTNACGVFYNK